MHARRLAGAKPQLLKDYFFSSYFTSPPSFTIFICVQSFLTIYSAIKTDYDKKLVNNIIALILVICCCWDITRELKAISLTLKHMTY